MGYIYNAASNHFIRTNTPEVGIPQLMWHITNRCELHCKFCFSIKNEDEFDVNSLDRYIQTLQKLQVQKIDLSGGEPMLHENFPQICNALYEAGIYITVTTRGIGLESNFNWMLDNLEKFARIIVSVDVPSAEYFADLSGNKALWHCALDLLQKLSDLQSSNIRINTVVTSCLLDKSSLEQLAQLIEQYGCTEWCLIEGHPANKKETFDQVSLSHSQFRGIVDRARMIWEDCLKRCLLVRECINYADYWVLYPDGMLAKHTDGEEDESIFPFLETPTNAVLNKAKNKIWVPEGRI